MKKKRQGVGAFEVTEKCDAGDSVHRIPQKEWDQAREIWINGMMELILAERIPDEGILAIDLYANPSGKIH